MTTPALYDVVIGHTRHVDVDKTFRHQLYTWLVDLDALPALPRPLRPFARFDARDHLGDPNSTIRKNLDTWLATQGVTLLGGRVLMLAHARVLGHAFNPITVYWCYQPDGELECIVAEVHNTYGERHCYLLRPDANGESRVDKQFYVSPFLPDHGRYAMRFDEPGEDLHLRIELRDEHERPLLTAVMTGHRKPATPMRLALRALTRPFVPQRVSALIRVHGVALWLRRIPIVARRPHTHQEAVR